VSALTALAACDGPPARSRAWRHQAPLAEPQAAAAPVSAPEGERERRATTLRIHLPVEPQSLDPLAEPDRPMVQVTEDTVFETLLRHGPGGYAPLLAESFRVTGGGNEVRFTLRAGVTFHDGRPCTASDAQFSIDAARRAASQNSRLRGALADVSAVEVWGPRDLRVVLRRPSGYALRAVAEVPIVPAALYGDGVRAERARAPVGTGPYRLARWASRDRLVLERFPGYWGAVPAIASVEFVVVPDAARALTLAKQGKIDIVPVLIPEHWPGEAESPAVTAAFAPLELAPARFVAGVFNLRRAPFSDERVRRAAIMLVDRWRLARDAWRGLARPVSGPVWPGGPGDAEGPPPPPFDPLWAGRLLDEAGYGLDKDGLRSLRVQPSQKLKVVLLTAGAGPAGEPDRDALVTSLRRGGFLVELRFVAPEDYLAKLKAGDFDLATIDYRGRVDESLGPLLGAGGTRNVGGLADRDLDDALGSAAEVWEPAARVARVAEVGRRAAALAPFLPLVRPAPEGLVARRVHGLAVHDGWFAVRDLSLE
jgi:ABC-type transport system substrate-binding protein